MTEVGFHDFTVLEVWQNARALRKEIYELVATFPAIEKFRLDDQLTAHPDPFAAILLKAMENSLIRINCIFACK